MKFQENVKDLYLYYFLRFPTREEQSASAKIKFRTRSRLNQFAENLAGSESAMAIAADLAPHKKLLDMQLDDNRKWLQLTFLDLLCRQPDEEAMSFYLNHLENSGLTRRWVVYQILHSKERTELMDRRKQRLGAYFEKSAGGGSFHRITNLQIEITTYCNINPPCPMCDRTWSDIQPRHMSPSGITSVQALLSDKTHICLFGQGEPLMNPEIWQFIDTLEKSSGSTGFTTNGLLLNPSNREAIISRKLGWINVSMDAATEKTYKRIRGQDFKKLCSNIQLLSEMRTESLPEITVNMLIMKSNMHEIADFCRLAAKLGADRVQFHCLNPEADPGRRVTAPDGHPFVYSEELIRTCDNAEVRNQLVTAEKICREQGLEFLFTGDYLQVEQGLA